MIAETDRKIGAGLTEASASLLEEIIAKNGVVAIGSRGRAKKKLAELGYIHIEGRAAGRATTEGKRALKTFRKPPKVAKPKGDVVLEAVKGTASARKGKKQAAAN
jgi:hypothetical protein